MLSSFHRVDIVNNGFLHAALSGKADFHYDPMIQIAVWIFDLPDKRIISGKLSA